MGAALLSWACVSACVVRVEDAAGDAENDPARPRPSGATEPPAGGFAGGPAGLDDAKRPYRVMTWNVEWLGDRTRGPDDETRQEVGIAELLARWAPDLVALQEVSDEAALARIVARLDGMAAIVAPSDGPQRLALLHRAAQFAAESVDEIPGLDDAGRPPLRIVLRMAALDATLDLVVVHAKAGRDPDDWERRHRFALGLAQTVLAAADSPPQIIAGDFNDRLDGSIVAGRRSPYGSLTNDGAYRTPTAQVDTHAGASTAWGATVDHVLVHDALAASVAPGSAEVVREDALTHAPRFLDEVSDHFPVTIELLP